MRNLHRALLALMVFGLVAGGAVVAQVGHGQLGHGSMSDDKMQEHIEAVAEQLNLTSRQRATLETAIERTHELMSEFHQLHADLMGELDTEQQHALMTMMHNMMSGMFGGRHQHTCDDATCPHHAAMGHHQGHGAHGLHSKSEGVQD